MRFGSRGDLNASGIASSDAARRRRVRRQDPRLRRHALGCRARRRTPKCTVTVSAADPGADTASLQTRAFRRIAEPDSGGRFYFGAGRRQRHSELGLRALGLHIEDLQQLLGIGGLDLERFAHGG